MTLPSILFLFLTQLGIGLTLTLLVISREVGVKFFRFNAGLAALLIAFGFAFRPSAPPGTLASVSTVALVVTEVALVAFWTTFGRVKTVMRPVFLPLAGLAGTVTLVAQALAIPAHGSMPDGMAAVLVIGSFLSSAALLGGACGAMSLGHWYLVIPSMDISHLQSVVRLHVGSLIARCVVVTAAVFFTIANWQPGLGPSFERYVLSIEGIFFWQRVLFGLVGPSLLAYMTWETAKIRSTQSATGILYVDFFTVIVGEILAKYVLLSTLVPV